MSRTGPTSHMFLYLILCKRLRRRYFGVLLSELILMIYWQPYLRYGPQLVSMNDDTWVLFAGYKWIYVLEVPLR